MVIAGAWGSVGGIASVVAAGAALVTVIYARATVRVARATRKESHDDHAQSLAAEREAAAATVAEQRAAVESAAAEHLEEMAERRRAFEAEIVLQRIVQLERLADVLTALIDAAREELVNPPPILNPPSPFRATRLPALLERLRTALAILDALGAPELPRNTQLGNEGGQQSPMQLVGSGRDALAEIGQVARSDERLRIAAPE